MIWQEGFNLPLYQSPGNIAVRGDLANYGAPGLADVDYSAIGFTRDPDATPVRNVGSVGSAPSAMAATSTAFHSRRIAGRAGSASSVDPWAGELVDLAAAHRCGDGQRGGLPKVQRAVRHASAAHQHRVGHQRRRSAQPPPAG